MTKQSGYDLRITVMSGNFFYTRYNVKRVDM